MKKESKNKKKLITIMVIFITIIVTIGIILTYIINNQNKNEKAEKNETYWVETKEDGKKINKSEKMVKTKEFEGLSLEKQEFVSKDSKTEISIKVTNNTQQDIPVTPIVLILLDKEGNEIVRLNGIINPTKVGESSKIYIGSSLDYVDAYDFKIERNNEL